MRERRTISLQKPAPYRTYRHAIDYVTKKEKTEEKLVSGLHCEPETVKEEMQATKELWGYSIVNNIFNIENMPQNHQAAKPTEHAAVKGPAQWQI